MYITIKMSLLYTFFTPPPNLINNKVQKFNHLLFHQELDLDLRVLSSMLVSLDEVILV